MANPCLKTSFCAVNFFYAITAIGLAAGAIWFSLKVQEITDLRNFEKYQLDLTIYWPQVLPYIFVAIAISVLLITCCGLGGAGTNNKAALITYNVFAAIVFVILIAAAVVAIVVATNKSEDFIKDTIHNVFQEAKLKPDVKAKFNLFESSLHCCGADGSNNYQIALMPIPASCCDAGTDCNNTLNQRKGCIEVATAYTKWAFFVGTLLCSLVAILCLVSMILAVGLIRSIRYKVAS